MPQLVLQAMGRGARTAGFRLCICVHGPLDKKKRTQTKQYTPGVCVCVCAFVTLRMSKIGQAVFRDEEPTRAQGNVLFISSQNNEVATTYADSR